MADRLATIAVSLTLAVLTTASRGRADLRAGDAAAAAGTRPNIVVLLVDDLDLGSFEAATRQGWLPHLTRFFADGTRFRESFVTEALCGPSRSTFFTGLYPHNHGVAGNAGPRGGFRAFQENFAENNLATWMQAAGYRTAHVGKYINGYADGTFVPRGWDEWQGLVDLSTYCMYEWDISNNGQPIHHGRRRSKDYQTDALAGIAVDFVAGARAGGDSRPLFLSLATLAPHREGQCFDGIRPPPRYLLTPRLPLPRPPSFNEPDMSDKPAWMQRRLTPVDEAAMAKLYNQRLAALRAVDDLFSRVVDAFAAVGELDRTAFLFASDNGYLLGKHRWEAKILLYEESIRVPLMLKVPGLAGPRTVDEIVLNNDIAPTIVALAQATPGVAMDGRSLLPLLSGTATGWRKRFEVTFPPQVAGPAFDEPAPPVPVTAVPPFFAVRSGVDGTLSQLIYAETLAQVGSLVTDRELYDLRPTVDPFQLVNRQDDPAYLVRRQQLKNHLDALRTCSNGTCQTLEE